MADEERKDWLEDFGQVMGGASDTVRNVVETIRAITDKQGPVPASLPEIRQQAKEQKDVQAEVKAPASGSFADSPWLPVAVIGLFIILMVKA